VAPMDDRDIVHEISRLAEEEHQIEGAHVGTPLAPEDEERLRSIEVALDQCWDLLRQRRARRSVGQNPDEAHVRPAEVVEHYQQ